MKQELYRSVSQEETARIAAEFARELKGGDTVVLEGELGAGKTAFVKGVAAAFGIDPDTVLSPTFVLLRIHEGERKLYHCDLYRLESAQEAFEAGIGELIGDPDAILLVEWADVLLPYLKSYYTVSATILDDGARLYRFGKQP